jgi:hypothetical protein
MEVGVWEGKSAALMALHCTETESCMFLDIRAMDGAKSRIEQVVPEAKCVFMQKNSRSVLQQPSILEMADRVRWMHIDGEHTAEAVMCDLQNADLLVARSGMVVIDDFFSPAYPQVTQAVFQFLATRPSRFCLVLCGFNKGYLCRPIAARSYLEFIKNSLYEEISSRGVSETTIWRTTEPSDMVTFGITDRYLNHKYRGPDWDEFHVPA